jgi:DNA-directed RNA polymerase subunit RPC12/RpoP
MSCPKCGNKVFEAHQLCRHNIVVDNSNNWQSNIDIYDSETPYGPYTCTECSAEYSELPLDIDEETEQIEEIEKELGNDNG